jgi:hypothetical protein
MRTAKRWATGVAAAIGGLLLVAGQAIAAPIPWSNSSGMTDSFMWSNGQSDNGLFGDPTPVGDELVFFPNNFKAVSTNGTAANTSDRLSFDIMMKPDFIANGFEVDELGDYSILGTGTVQASGGLFVTNLNPPVSTENDTLHTTPLMPIVAGSGNWSGFEKVTLDGWTKFHVVLDNVLQATSGPNSASQIEKKVTQGIVIKAIIPEPATLSLLLVGGGLMALRRRGR